MALHPMLPALLVALCCSGLAASEMTLPRGVPMSRASLYPAGETFTCLDGSDTIAFTYINDDYCDCEDGSDEPGTSACAGGLFYCPNRGHVGQEVPSSWVNDGVCDCCDGSDEHATGVCQNTCDTLGAVVRARQAQQREIRLRGYELRRQLVDEGKQKLTEKETRLTELEREKQVATSVKEQREAAKTSAEEQERVLLDAYQEAQRDVEREQEEADRQAAVQYFTQFDTDHNGLLTVDELKLENKLDKNGDGSVTQDEVDSVTMNRAEIDQEDFVTSIWPLLKTVLQETAEEGQPQESSQETQPPSPPDDLQPPEQHEDDLEEEEHLTEDAYEPADEDEEDEDEDHGDDDEEPAAGIGSYKRVGREHADLPSEPEYDAETQTAVDAAKQARSELSEAEQTLRDIEREMTSVTAFTALDLGPDRVFAALYHQCFTLENREYEYKLCMFDKASQKPRSGGVETSLGRWGHWVSPEANGHTEHLYENGQQCWNGPKRTAHVTLTCGEETRMLDVTEPAMCEYLFTMETPAVCQLPAEDPEQHYHDEL